MTDPGPVAALAAQLEELRGQLARSQGDIGHLRERLETEGIGGTMRLLLDLKQLREQLDDAVEKRRLKPPPAPWWRVGEAEGRAMLAELSEWVDGFARRHYPGYMTWLPRCWANHPEAVWE